MSPMQYSGSGVKLTQSFEGCKLKAYLDSVGVPTIGYGHTRDISLGMVCTQAQADAWLLEDIQVVVVQLNNALANIVLTLTQGMFDALVDFGFNLGVHAEETSTLWRKLLAHDFCGAATEFPRWDKAGGKKIEGLTRRRIAEQKEFLEGTSCSA